MSSGTPYIGSKISLVSKAEIRYEGFLYTIDQNDSTVTLAKVISLGTEDRVPDNPVPAREEVFEYIVFRGSDIKDLHVCEGPKRVEDPAIVHQSSHSYSQPNNPYHNRNYAPFGPGGGMHNFGYYPFNFHQNGPGDAPSSRQPPPSLPRTPTPEPPKQTTRDRDGGQQHRDRDNSGQYNRDRDGSNQHRDREGGQHRDAGQHQNKSQTSNYQDRKRNNDRDTKENRDGKDESVIKDNRDKRNTNRESKENYRDNRDNRNTRDHQDNREQRENRNNRDNRDNRDNHRDNRDNRYRQSYVRKDNSTQEEEKEHRYSGPRGRGQSRGGRGGRGYAGGRGNSGRGGVSRGGNTRTKFTEDFDFETANAKFNKEEIEKELLKVLKKVKIKDDDGESSELKDTKEEKESDERAPLPSPDKFYDRSKSFFDNIRCEAMVPKSEDEVMTRRQEQALNAETFGSSASHYRPGFRGRGRGRGRWRGRGRGFRGRGSYRGNSNRPWVDYEFDYEAVGMKNRHQPMKVST